MKPFKGEKIGVARFQFAVLFTIRSV